MQTLTEAEKDNLILKNPCFDISLPKLERCDYSFYSAEQIRDLFNKIANEPLCPLIKITSIYGLRRSEVLGLKWDSIDFEANMLTIKHTVSQCTQAIEKDKTKNHSSYRSFPLTDEAKKIFIGQKEKEQQNKILFGNEYICNDYVFKWDNGKLYAPAYISHKFTKILKQYNLPHIRFHELRHSCASILIALGFTLKDIQEWLGHADIKVTANIYSHLDIKKKLP